MARTKKKVAVKKVAAKKPAKKTKKVAAKKPTKAKPVKKVKKTVEKKEKPVKKAKKTVKKVVKIDEYILQTTVTKRLIKEGAESELEGARIGATAVEVGKMAIEEYGTELASQASTLLQLGKKKTISDKEILVAANMCTKDKLRSKTMEAKIPLATLKKILKRGAKVDERISAPAILAAQGLIGRFAYELGRNAALIAVHDKRKTIKDDDIKYALDVLGRKIYA